MINPLPNILYLLNSTHFKPDVFMKLVHFNNMPEYILCTSYNVCVDTQLVEW